MTAPPDTTNEITSSSVSSTTSTTQPADFPVFLAAVELALADSSYADAVIDDADVFVAIGQLMCERLDEGASADDVLVEFLGRLDPGGSTTDDEVVAIGVTFGAAIESLCPRHRTALE